MGLERDIREFDGKMFEAVSVRDVGPGDFIKVRDELIMIRATSLPEGGSLPRSWVVDGDDGRSYNMYEIGLYLKPERRET